MSVTTPPLGYDSHDTEAELGYGLSLQLGEGEGSSITYTDTGLEIKDFSAPELTRDTVDVTNHRSPGGFKEYIPALLDAGEVSFTVNYVPRHSANPEHPLGVLLNQLYEVGNTAWRIRYTDGTFEEFLGSVTGFSRAIPVEDAMTADITMKVSGKPELTAPTTIQGGALPLASPQAFTGDSGVEEE